MLDWPLRDLFQAAVERRKDAAWRLHNEAFMRWATLCDKVKTPGKPPELPEILRG